MTGIVGSQLLAAFFRIRAVDKVFSVEELCLQVFHALVHVCLTCFGKAAVIHLFGHSLCCLYCSNTQTHQPGYLSIPHGIQGVFNGRILHAIPVTILADYPLGGALDFFPVVAEKGIISTHLMLPVKTENCACLTVYSRPLNHFPAVPDHAIGLQRQSKVHALAGILFYGGEDPRHGLGILPNMHASAFTAPHTFPCIETARLQPVCCGGGQGGDVQECAFEEPMWKRGILPGFTPQGSCISQVTEVFVYIMNHIS